MKVYLMLDVGGTNIKAGVLSEDGNLWEKGILSFDAKAKGSREEIFQNMASVLSGLIEEIPKHNFQIAGIGMAFPGPFDYERGISLMQKLDKYNSIYGICIPEELKKYFPKTPNGALLTENSRYFFLHDVESFAVGECYFGNGRNCEKVMYLCMGTGAGSAFTDKKRILKGEDGRVPYLGQIYDTPFKESIIDDYLSIRGLESISTRIFGEAKNGKELFDLCLRGDERAFAVYGEFGDWLKEAVTPFLDSFQPDGFVLGGQISKSFSFFGGAFAKECRKRGTAIYLTEDTSRRAMEGLYIRMRSFRCMSLEGK